MVATKFKNDVAVTGTLTVTGVTTFSGAAAVTGALTVGGAASVTGALTVTGIIKDENANVVVHTVPATATVTAKATGATIVAGEFGTIVTNTGAAGSVTHTLPAASTVAGKSIVFKSTVAQVVNISPAATDGIFLDGSGVDDKDLVIAGVIGNRVTIFSNGDNYEAYYGCGVITKEA
jgi:hypothetical protein